MLEFKQWMEDFAPLSGIRNDLSKIARRRLGAAMPSGNGFDSVVRNRLGAAMPDDYGYQTYHSNGIRWNFDREYVIVNVKYLYNPAKNEPIDRLVHKARQVVLADPKIKKTLEDVKASWYLTPKRTGMKDIEENGQHYKLFTFYFKKNSRPDIKPIVNTPQPPPNLPPENAGPVSK